ncbi:MAG TPA: type VII secretion protein EccCa [Trebonia sp.]|nr:type VII secretion protein EccCa [Trebonia sp.]
MSRIAWHRPARIAPPGLPQERVSIPLPPQVPPQSGNSGWLMMVMPLLSSASIAAYLFTEHSTTLTYVAVGIITVSVAVTGVIRYQTRSAARRARERRRHRYLAHLADIRRSARDLAAAQRAAAAWQWPGPRGLWAIANERRRVWERRPDDEDFLILRAGVGSGPLASPVQLSNRADPTTEYDTELLVAAERLAESFATVGGQAATVDLLRAGVVSIVGDAQQARAVCRGLLCQLAVLHAPDDVAVAVSAGKEPDEWLWATWLPHARESARADDSASQVLVAADFADLADVIERELTMAEQAKAAKRARVFADRPAAAGRHLVVVIDGFHAGSPWARESLGRRLVETAGPGSGITVVALATSQAEEPSRVGARLRVNTDGTLTLEARRSALISEVTSASADMPPAQLCEATARALAPLTLAGEQRREEARAVPLTELLGIADMAGFDPAGNWLSAADDGVLRSGIGLTDDGVPVTLDLKESARGGMGPHGLIVGATGSGKSELLRTLLTGLAARHSPELLSLVLIDFKGGATFAPMAQLPHVAGLITNLADDLALVDRVRDALIGEQQRRQRLLRDAGNVDSVRDYQIRQAAGERDASGRPLEPLPYLLVVVDEFGELLSGRPDFINLFVQIGRVGRSLGIHLLLATQRLEEGRLRGLESHLSYRIGLRTFSAVESRTVLGTPDAYHLPHLPGAAYLKVGESVYERFRVAYVSAPEEEEGDDVSRQALPAGGELEVLRLREAPVAGAPAPAIPAPSPSMPSARARRATQMQVLVTRLREFGRPVHQVWLPPLPRALALGIMLSPLKEEPGLGLQGTGWPLRGSLRFPVGVIDLPATQEQQPLVLDLGQAHPHVVLVGAPQTGKSTFLRTAMLSAMLTNTPAQLQFSCLDYGGGSLHALGAAPHVSAVAVRGEEDLARRILSETLRLIEQREGLFRSLGITSAAELRRRRDAGTLSGMELAADACLVIDNWGGLRSALPEADAAALEIAARGPGVGVHLLLTAGRWGDIRMNLRDAIGARLELKLNDPAESEVNRAAARLIPSGLPGRGLSPPGHQFQVLLPRADEHRGTDGLREAQDEALAAISSAWHGTAARPVRLLPETVHVAELPADAQDGPGALIGIGERDLAPVRVDLTEADPHCIVVGDGSAGKTSFLRTWMRGLAARYAPEEVRFMVIDYRRGLGDTVPAPYIGAYAGDARTAGVYAQRLAEVLAGRLPPAGISARELRDRAWWTGPELYLVVDDYDVVEGASSPLRPLLDYLPSGREIGFHVVVTRRSGGIARALMTDPVISRIRELGAVSLVLSADPREGVIADGVRGSSLLPGRGVLVRRRAENEMIQVLLSDPVDTGSTSR